MTGIDECFPNIGLSTYPGKPELQLPDHGELWSRKWNLESGEGWLRTETEGSIFPYRFVRKISLVGSELNFEYEIENIGAEPFFGFWTLHALFRAEPDMRIVVKGNPRMTKEFGFSSRIGQDGEDGYKGHLDPYQWPKTIGANGESYDLSQIDLDKPITDKVVLQTPQDGEIQLVHPRVGRTLKFSVNQNQIPFIGICYNLGAWPFTGAKATWVAIEPSHGATDRLDESVNLGAAIEFQPKQPMKFGFNLHLE